MSPGLDFETRIIAKVNAAQRLREAFAARPCAPALLNRGAVTDAYHPAGRKRGITLSVLEVLAEWSHPFSIVTKSASIERDLGLTAPMAARVMTRLREVRGGRDCDAGFETRMTRAGPARASGRCCCRTLPQESSAPWPEPAAGRTRPQPVPEAAGRSGPRPARPVRVKRPCIAKRAARLAQVSCGWKARQPHGLCHHPERPACPCCKTPFEAPPIFQTFRRCCRSFCRAG